MTPAAKTVPTEQENYYLTRWSLRGDEKLLHLSKNHICDENASMFEKYCPK